MFPFCVPTRPSLARPTSYNETSRFFGKKWLSCEDIDKYIEVCYHRESFKKRLRRRCIRRNRKETRLLSSPFRIVSSVDNWGLLSFILNMGISVQIRAGWFRLRCASTLFLSPDSYVWGLSTGETIFLIFKIGYVDFFSLTSTTASLPNKALIRSEMRRFRNKISLAHKEPAGDTYNFFSR